MTPVEIVAGLLLAVGGFFLVSAAIGVLRFPDVYTRLHASGVGDTLGAGLVLAGLLVITSFGEHGWVPELLEGHGWHGAEHGVINSFKLISILFFMWVSGTTACHALAKAAWLAGVEPWQAERDDADRGGEEVAP